MNFFFIKPKKTNKLNTLFKINSIHLYAYFNKSYLFFKISQKLKSTSILTFFKIQNMRKITFLRTMLVALSFIALSTANSFGQFTAGNLVVEQVGDGTTTLSSAATTVKLLQFAPDGTPATGTSFFGSTGTPTTAPYNIVESGSATSNGYIS